MSHGLIEIVANGMLLFPAIIFLDYHKKDGVRKALTWIVCFYAAWFFIPLIYGLLGIWALLLFPIAVFTCALWRQPHSNTDHLS